MDKELIIEAREAIAILLHFYEDLTCEDITLPFISDPTIFKKFVNNYDLDYVYKVNEKLKQLKG